MESMGYALVGAVPLRMWELREARAAELMALAREAARTIAEKGDIFQFQNGRRDAKPSMVLSALITAYAVLALNTPDSGVTRFGFHACRWEHEGCPKNLDR
ncbi:hypothetical protein [Streptomyces sp. NPDC001089]